MSNLIILGTPDISWFGPASTAAMAKNEELQMRFSSIFNDLYGDGSHDSALKGTVAPKHNPEILRNGVGDLSHLLGSSNSSLLTDARACWIGKEIIESVFSISLVAYFSSPENYIANIPKESDPVRALEIWKDSARCLLSLVRSSRSKVTLLSAEECISASDAHRKFIHERFDMTPWELKGASCPDDVRLALACIQVSMDKESLALFAELEAASHPLSDSTFPRPKIPQVLEKAWQFYNKNLIDKKTQEENELLLLQLHQVQEELESSFLKLKENQEKLEKVKKSQETERKNYEDKLTDQDRQRKLHESEIEKIKVSSSQAIAKCNDSIKNLEVKQTETQEENELLLLQLHQVQEELEHYFLENKRLEKQRFGFASEGARLLRFDSFRLGQWHDTPPHRHLDFTLENAVLGDRELGAVRMRLVEHSGRPGLLVFQGYEQEPPLQHWQSNGEENGIAYMLVVPQDVAGRDFLVAATTSDILLFKEAASLLSVELQASSEHANASRKNEWVRIARRFAELIEDVPARLHYDDIVATCENKVQKFNLKRIWTARRGYSPSLAISWTESLIEIALPADAPPPLANWPHDDASKPCPSLVIDLNPAGKCGPQREFWQRLTSNDREMLLQVISELPNFIYHLIKQNPSIIFDADKYRHSAKSLLKRARSLATGAKPRRKFLGLF
jgi:hypothetical protein